MVVKLGFIGFGIMGERLLRAALNHDKSRIVVAGVFDPSPKASARLQAISPYLAAFTDADAVIQASDCLHIASPPASHLAYLRQCADAGKAALCEKPLAIDVSAANAAVADLTARGMRAAVNFPFASSFAVDHLRRWLHDGTVGTPQRVDIDLAFAAWPRSWQRDAAAWLDGPAEGGFTREVGSHFLFLARRFFGPLRLVSAQCDRPQAGASERGIEAKLTAGAMAVHLGGAVGTTSKDDHNTWTLTGSSGRVRLRDWSIAEREVEGTWQSPGDGVPNEAARPLVLARQLDKIADMTGGLTTDLATLADALDVQMAVEGILRAQ